MKSFTQVEGVKVVDAQQARSALSKPGKPVYFTGTQELLLEDGRVVYGCIWCGVATDAKIGKLRLHQRYSCPDRPASERKPSPKKHYPTWTKKPEVEEAKEKQHRRVTSARLFDPPRPDVAGGSEPSPRREPPPSAASDILAALKAGDPTSQALNAAQMTVKTLSRDMTTVIKQRDAYKAKYEGLEVEMNKIRDLLKERGLM